MHIQILDATSSVAGFDQEDNSQHYWLWCGEQCRALEIGRPNDSPVPQLQLWKVADANQKWVPLALTPAQNHLCRAVGHSSVTATALLCKAAVKLGSQLTLSQKWPTLPVEPTTEGADRYTLLGVGFTRSSFPYLSSGSESFWCCGRGKAHSTVFGLQKWSKFIKIYQNCLGRWLRVRTDEQMLSGFDK